MLRREAHQPEAARALAMFFGGAGVAGVRWRWCCRPQGVGAATAARRPGHWVLPARWRWRWSSSCGNLALQYGAARLTGQRDGGGDAHRGAVRLASRRCRWAPAPSRRRWRSAAALIIGAALLVSPALTRPPGRLGCARAFAFHERARIGVMRRRGRYACRVRIRTREHGA
jgi:hypothetical protein